MCSPVWGTATLCMANGHGPLWCIAKEAKLGNVGALRIGATRCERSRHADLAQPPACDRTHVSNFR